MAITATAAAVVVQVNAQTAPPVTTYVAPKGLPSMRLLQQTQLVTPQTALSHYGSPTSPAAPARGVRLKALARGLEHGEIVVDGVVKKSPDRIYTFVRDNFEFEPQFGLHKGAEGLWMDRAGGAFDQAQLMVDLLRESGIPAQYALGTVSLGAEAADILRVENARQACVLLASSGVPATVNGQTDCAAVSGAISNVTMLHVWVKAQVDGQWWSFDPALKRHDKVAGVDLWAAMGKTASSAWSDLAGGLTNGSRTVGGLSVSNIESKLGNMGSTLQGKLKGELSAKSLRELTGGWTIRPGAAADLRRAALPYATEIAAWTGDVPAAYRATLQVMGPGFNRTFDLPSIYAERVQAVMNDTTFQVVVRVCEGRVDQSTCEAQNTYSGTSGSRAAWDRTIQLKIDHPYAYGTFGDETVTKVMPYGARAELVVRSAGGSGDRYEAQKAAVEQYIRPNIIPAGYDWQGCQNGDVPLEIDQNGDLSCPLQPEPLYFRADGPTGEIRVVEMKSKKDDHINLWTALFDRITRVVEPLSASRIVHQHSLGVVVSAYETTLDIETTLAVASGGADQPHVVLGAMAALSSSFEGAAPHQVLGGNGEGIGGEYSGVERLTKGASAGAITILQPGESSSLLPAAVTNTRLRQEVDRYLAKDYGVAVTAQEGGYAFYARRADGAEASWMIYDDTSTTVDTGRYAFRKGAEVPNPLSYLGKEESRQIAKNVAPTQMGAVDLQSGGLSFSEAPDVTSGQGDFPYSLSFSRSYSSGGSPSTGGGLGVGWSHNWASSSGRESDILALLPDAEPVAAAATLTAVAVALEAARHQTIEADLVAGATVTWWAKQGLANVVQLSGGGSSARFLKQLDGSWRNPAAPAEVLTELGLHEFDRKLSDGSVQSFRPVIVRDRQGTIAPSVPALQTWTFPSGVVVTLTYGAQEPGAFASLRKVANNLGAQIIFEHQETMQEELCKHMAPATCHYMNATAGTLMRVSAGSNTATFSYVPVCERETNLCYSYLVSAAQPLKRTRGYAYYATLQTPSGYEATADYTYSLLWRISDSGVSQPRAVFNWDASGWMVRPHVLSSVDAAGRTTEYYTPGAYYGAAKDTLGNRYSSVFDEDGRLTAVTDPLKRTAMAAYDSAGRTAMVKSPYGDRTELKYDARGNLVEQTRRPSEAVCAPGNTDPWWCQTITVTAEYHPTWNKPTKITLPPVLYDPVHRSYDLTYNSQGLVSEMLEPEAWDGVNGRYDRPVWKSWYDSYGRVTRRQDPTGIEALNAYGENGQPAFCLTSTTESAQLVGGLNLKTSFTCNAVGDVLTTTDPRNNVTTTSYDALRRKLETVGPAGTNIRTQWVYDLDGNVTDEKRWDATAGLWRTTTTTYSPTNKPLTVTDPDGDVTRSCYDALDRVIVAVDGENRAVKTVYDAAGQVLRVEKWWKVAAGDACALTADLPAGQTNHAWRTYEYDAGGHVKAEIDANGNRTDHQYEGLGRLIITYYPDPDGAGPKVRDQENFLNSERGTLVYKRHRAPGNVTSEMTQYWYDPVGRQRHSTEFTAGTTWPQGRNVRRSHDLAGRPVFADVSQQAAATWSEAAVKDLTISIYDKAGRLEVEHNYLDRGANPGLLKSFVYGYDAAGNRTSVAWPDGWTATFGYDAANRLQTISFPGGSVTYASDSLSRRTSVTRSNGTSTSYAWQADGDLTSIGNSFAAGSSPTAFSFDYGYSKAGQITSKAVTGAPQMEWMPTLASARTYGAVNPLNQLSAANGAALTFDVRGNMSSDGVNTYVHDLGNRLVSATRSGMTATYAYDGDDRRTVKTVNGVVTRTLWSGNTELAQTDGSGNIQRRFVPGLLSFEHLASVDMAGGVTWQHVDHQGSVVAISGSIGRVIETASYSPTGQHHESDQLQSLPAGAPFGYHGQQYDPETGLYYYKARYYSPALGQFLEVDPIGSQGDPNLYLYTANDPVTKMDVTGKDWVWFQKTGQMAHYNMSFSSERKVPNEPGIEGDPVPDIVLEGYSGFKDAANDPDAQNQKNRGPIPRGFYYMSRAFKHPKFKGLVIRLTPDAANNMFGRDGFLIHGDNGRGDNSASEGCIILDKAEREIVESSGDNRLWVKPGMPWLRPRARPPGVTETAPDPKSFGLKDEPNKSDLMPWGDIQIGNEPYTGWR